MSKPSSYELVTNQILEALEKGVIPWRLPWQQQSARPTNIRGSLYRGINYFMLSLFGSLKGYASPYWLTFKQAKDNGGNVKAGEKATPVVFWKNITVKGKDKEDNDSGDIGENPDNANDGANDNPCEANADEYSKSFWMVKHYYVFNIEQTENVSVNLPSLGIVPREFSPIERAEAIVAGYPHPPIIEYSGDRALYRRSTDTVILPPLEHFLSDEDYYDTLFHELGHSTAHTSRLNRPIPTDKKERAMEELIAELTDAFLCSEAGISQPVIGNQAAYIESWLEYLKNDKGAFLLASSRAQKAADYILNRKFAEQAQTTPGEAA